MYSINDFWIPNFKYQLVEWLDKNYPNNLNGEKINWSRFSKKQLLGIYINKRKKIENHPIPKKFPEQLELFK